MLLAVFVLLMPSKLCFHSSLLDCKAPKKKPLYLAAAITLLPLQGPAHQKQYFYSLGSRPVARSPSCDVSRVRCLPPWRGREEAAAPASLIDFLCCVQVFMLKPGLSLRSTYLAQFLLLLHRKALTLLKYIEDDT